MIFATRLVSMSESKAILEPGPAVLSLSRQCKILFLSWSSAYYQPKCESAGTLTLMRRIDELFMASPFYGSHQMQSPLALEGIAATSFPKNLKSLPEVGSAIRK